MSPREHTVFPALKGPVLGSFLVLWFSVLLFERRGLVPAVLEHEAGWRGALFKPAEE